MWLGQSEVKTRADCYKNLSDAVTLLPQSQETEVITPDCFLGTFLWCLWSALPARSPVQGKHKAPSLESSLISFHKSDAWKERKIPRDVRRRQQVHKQDEHKNSSYQVLLLPTHVTLTSLFQNISPLVPTRSKSNTVICTFSNAQTAANIPEQVALFPFSITTYPRVRSQLACLLWFIWTLQCFLIHLAK